MKVEVTSQPNKSDDEAVLAGLRAYNRRFAENDAVPLCVVARDEGSVVGGLDARTYWNYLDIKYFWVHEDRRGQGLGATILRAAEAEAVRRGCAHAFLDTFEFQARGFYEKMGYTVFGQLDGFSGRHRRYFMRKDLAAGA